MHVGKETISPHLFGNKTIKLGPMQPARYHIPVIPAPKDRTRGFVAKSKTGKLISVQRKTTRSRAYESLVEESAMLQHPIVGPFNSRLSVSIAYYCEQMRGDIDNLAKATLDGMNKAVWTDDTLIDELYARRVKCPPGVPAQSVVLVRQLQPNIMLPNEVFTGETTCPMCGSCTSLNQEIPF